MPPDALDELQASVEMGSGIVCLTGPPGSGKTTLLLDFLVQREELFREKRDPASSDANRTMAASTTKKEAEDEGAEEVLHRACQVEYLTARSFAGDALPCLVYHLQDAPRKRMRAECSALDFGMAVVHWASTHAEGSELHVVVDDADFLSEDDDDGIDRWLSYFLSSAEAQTRRVFLWIVAQHPKQINTCFRYHFFSPASIDVVLRWLDDAHTTHRGLLHFDEESEGELEEEFVQKNEKGSTPSCARLSAVATQQYICKAVEYYWMHKPMSASLVCRDVRLLLQRVYRLLPALVLLAPPRADDEATDEAGVALNARHYAQAWGSLQEEEATHGAVDGSSSRADPLVRALRSISYSAVLLAFAAFYAGAVPRSKQMEVFSTAVDPSTRARAEAKRQTHKAAVLSAAEHVVSIPQLLQLYDAMLAMCATRIDPLEFAPSSTARHYVCGLISWGLLTPVLSMRRHTYHCWIPVSTAVSLGNALSLNLYDLIPT